MKCLYFLALAGLGSLVVHAQTNLTATPATPHGPTVITSDTADFDLGGHEATYRGHVRVDDPQMQLVCEQLIADVPQAGGHVNHIVATTNVLIDFLDSQGRTNHAISDKAVYVYAEQGGTTNETITLTGNPPNPQMLDAQSNTLTGDVIVLDCQTKHVTASNQRIVYRHNFSGAEAATNAPAANSGGAGTNNLSAPKKNEP